MYLAGVSVRRVENITEALWGSKVSPATISELNKKAYVHIEDWRNRPLLPQRVLCDASFQGETGSQNAQGDPCPGEQKAAREKVKAAVE